MAINEELRPSNHPALAGSLCLRVLMVLVALAAATLAGSTLRQQPTEVEFLRQALGAPDRTAPLQRSLPTGERFRISDRALVAESDFGRVALQPIGLARGADWTRTENGATRATSFGRRTFVLDGTKAEEFLTVEERQGRRTWRWRLDTTLDPSLRVDGRVALVDRATGGTFEIAPVRILDAGGDDVTPTGLRWTVTGHTLALSLDDGGLPLPYVIDPAITVIAPTGTHATTTTASLSLAKPTGTLVNGSTILVAHVSKRNADAVAATGWTSIGQTCNGTTVCTALLWKKFAGEAGPYSFNWTNGVGGAGGIVALANVWQPGSRSPVDSFVGASGTGTTADPGSLTNLFTTLGELVVGGFAAQGTTPGVPTGKSDAGSAAITSGAQGNRIGVRTATLNETAAAVANWASTLTSAAWSAQIAGFIPQANDGSGTLTTTSTDVAASSTGNTIAFTYTPNAGLDNGSLSVQVPAGWTAPQTGPGNGQVTVSGGTGTNSISITGSGPWTVRVDNVQLGDTGSGGIETLTITYANGTASASTGAQTWQAQSRGTSTGTMTNLGSSPSITVRAANGSGTVSSSVSNVGNGATAQTATFTYTAVTGGMASGAVTVDVPSGWTAPNTTAGTPGYTAASTGTVSAVGQKITVSGVTLAAAASLTITYGSGGGGGATATTTAGPATWQVQQRSVTGGTLTNLGSSPSINVYDANTAGSISQTAGPSNVASGVAIGSAITWTFTAGAGGMSGGSLGITVPSGWSAPRTTAGAGFTSASAGTLGVSGQQIQVTGLTLAAGATMTVTYGSGGGGNLPVAGTTAGANTFGAVKHSTAGIGSAVATTSQPATINVYAADGSGTIGVAPTSAVAGSTGNTHTFTYTAATGGIAGGSLELTIPSGWTAPQTASSTSAGYTTASGGSGANTIAWNGGTRKLTVSDVTLAAAATLTITYGANAGSGGGAAAPTSTGAGSTWSTQQKSTSGGTLTSVGTSPGVTIAPGPLSDFLVEAAGSGAIGSQTAGSSFSIRVTARDAYGNTVTGFNGAGNTVDLTSTGTLSAGGGTTGTFTNGVLASHSVTITSSGSRTITATRTSGGAQTGTSASFTVAPTAAVSLDVAAPASATAGTPFSVDVTARDTYGNVASGYLGTVAFSGGGTGAQLPANYSFVGGDAGAKTFSGVELRQAGSRTVTVTDTVTGSITGNDSVTVAPGAASLSVSTVSAAPTSITANGSSTSTVTLRLKDAFGNDLPAGDGATYAFSTDRGSVGAATDNGDGTYSATLTSSTSAGTATVSATRNAAAFSAAAAVTFAPGPAAVLEVAAPATTTAGAQFAVTVTAKDVNGNTATGYTGTIAFSGGGTGAQLPANYTFVPGDAGTKTFASVELRQAGSRTITATDTVTGSVTGGDTLTVNHAPAASLDVAVPASGITGQPFSATVTAKDAYANVATGYLGTITFSTAGGGGSVPADYTFVAGDNGNTTVAGFSFSTPGSKSVVATDTVNGSVTGSGSITISTAGASLATSTFGASPTSILANGSSTSTITLQLKDAIGNDFVVGDGASYVFNTSGGSVGSATDNGDGTVTATLTSSTSAGVATVSATRDGSPFANSVAVTFSPGAATTLEVSAPATATAGAPFSVDVTARDAFGNVATGYLGTVSFSGGGTGAQLPANYTFVSGDAGTKTFASVELRQAGSRTITATDTVTGSITGADTLTVGHGSAAQIALTGSTADLTSGASRVLTATIQDTWGNTVTSDSSTVVAFAKASGAGTVSGAGNATASGGVAAKTITGVLAGSVTLEATSAGLTTGTLGAFTVVHGAATEIALTGSTADLTSGGSRALTATIKDAAGNTVTSDSATVVTFAKASGAGTVTGTGDASAANGIATKTITGALAGTVTMEASAAGLTSGSLAVFTVVHGAAASISLTGSTTDLTSGASRVLTATIQDAAGNTVTSDSSTVIGFSNASGTGTVSGTGNATAANGVATKSVTGVLAGPVAMEATAAGLTTGTLGAFTVVHGAAASISLTGSTADLTSGTSRVLTATIQDAVGNTVTSDSTTVVAFAKASGAGTVSGTGNATASAGVVTKSVTGVLAGSVTMEATAVGLSTGSLGAFTVVHGPAADIVLTGSTADLTSGGSRALTATIKDPAGNTVTSDSTTVVAFAKASGAGTVSGTGNATAANGVATKTITGALAGAVTMEATATGLTTGTLGAFTVVHGAAASISLTGSTADLTSGASRVLTATIQDAAGNTVTSDSTTVIAFAKASGAGTVSGTGTATASAGVATKTITGALAGTVTMEATAAGLATGTLGAFTVAHGAATQIQLTGSTADLTSGATRILTATIQDAAGNTVTSDNSTVVAFAKASGIGTVSGTGNATVSAGIAAKTLTGVLAGPVTMEATAAGLTTGTLAAFGVVHGAATQIQLSGSTADLTSGANRVLTATIEDAAGNTVTSDSSTVVAFAKASGTGTVSGTGNATAANGIATKTVTGALAGSVTMEATATGLTTGTLAAFTVVHGAATQLQLSGSTADLTSGATRVLTATIQDAAGNTVTSDSSTVVAFAKASGIGTVSGTGNAIVAAGVATKTVTGVLAGSVTMEATAAGLSTGTLGAFTVVHGPAADIVLTGSTADLISGGSRLLTATIKDPAGNTVTSDSSTVVTFAKASGAGTVTGTGNASAANGIATKTITGALAGTVTMEATAAGLTTGTLGAFTVVHGAATSISLTGSTADLTSGATRVLTATIRDAAGNTVTGDSSTVVAVAQASGTGTVSDAGNATAANGVATKTITGALAGTVTMEATAAGLATGTLGAFTVAHGAATEIALTGSTADLTSGATRILTATIQDAAGNTVTSDNSTVVAFAKASGTGTVTGTGNASAANGIATKTITGALAGTVAMEATGAGLTTGTLGAFTVVHGAATQIALTHSGSTASGDNHSLTATIRDAAGNTVTSDSTTVVTFAKTAGAGTATGLGNATASGGVAAKIVVNAASGQIDLDAQAAGLTTGTTSYTITAGAASTLTSTITASPTSIVADGSSTSAITVQLKDSAGNDLSSSGGVVALTLTGTGSLSAATDNGDGTYAATLTSPTAVGAGTVTGTLNAAALAASAGVTYTHGPAAQIVLDESGSTVAGNAHTLTATIEDAHGNTVTSDNSTVVAFAKTGGAGTVTGLGNATASAGVATKAVTNRLAGQIDLDAQASGLTTGTTNYTIVVGPVSAAASDSTVVAAPTTVYANGSDSATITVTLRDAGGNGIAGKAVTLDQGAGGSAISGGGSTSGSGVVTFTVSDASVETVTYTATDTTDSITLTDDASVAFTFADATPPTNTITLGSATRAWLTGATLYYNGAAGGSFTLSSAVADGGSGPASADYPAVVPAGWTHGAETVSTPAGGPYVSGAFTFAAGASGNFTYDVTASDAWTPPNTSQTTLNVTEDSAAPAASILCNGAACVAGWHTAAPVSVTLAAPDAGAGLDQIRYTTDGTDPTILSGNVYAGAFAVAAEGVTTVKYRAFDRIGNDTGVQTQTVRIDTIAPDTTIDSAPGAATQDTTPTLAFSSPEAGSTFAVRVNGGSWTTETSPLTLGPLAESTYTLEVRATDVAGNVDASPASFTVTVDTTPANTTITSAPAVASDSADATFSFTASDAGPGFECRLDGGAFADCSSPKSYTGLSEAAHTFEVRAEDAAGNLDATPAAHTWTVDLTAPDTSFPSTPANPSPNPTPSFGLGSNEAPSTFECDLDGGGWAPCSTPLTTPALGDGSHTLEARATDAAGNTDATEVSFTWLVDATAPTGSLTSPANGADVGGTIVLASNSADAGGSGVATISFERSPAGAGSWTPQAASWNTTLQADGDFDLRVVTTDNAGNSFTSPVITVTVDNTEPALSVVAPNPVNLATADPATLSAVATDDGSGIANVRFDQCAEDSAACLSDSWVLLGVDTGAPFEASWPIPSDGPRLLRVRATDNAGKQKTELVLVTIDRIRPAGSLTAPAAGANLRGASVALAATASDTAPGAVNTVTFQRSPAGAGTWTDVAVDASAPYAGTLDTTALADGLYDLRVFTTDAAGNAEATPATIQVRVDNTNPTGSVTAPAGGANVRGTIGLTSDSADAGSGVATVVFQRSPAGAGTWTTQAASFDTTAVADGLYDLRVTTTDNAGNTFGSAASTIRVDNTNPTGSVTAPAGGANVRGTIGLTSDSADTPVGGSASGVATVVFQHSPAGAGTWTNQAASFDTTAVADGLYDLRATTTDNAGNTFSSAATTIRVDNTNPTGTVTAPLNGAEIGVAPVTLTSSSADAGGSGVASVAFERSPAGAGIWTATPSSWNTASGPDAVADGSYDLRVKTADNAGNVFTSPAITVLVDHTAPTTSASLAPGTPSNAPVTVSFSASDGTGSGVSVISYRVDGGSLQSGAAVVVSAPGDHSNDGAHVVEFFSTDEVGNVEVVKNVTVVIDTTAPSGSGGDLGDYLRGIATLTYATAAADVSSVQFQFSPAGAGAWSNVGAADIAPPYEASWNTTLAADGPYDLRAVVTDVTGNVANTLLPGLPKTVDNTAPAGSVTAPLAAAFVSGSIAVDANATDGAVPPASGVSAVRFEIKPAGAGAYSVFGTQTAPVVGSTYRQTLATTGVADGPADLRVVVTDVAGNETTSAVTTTTVDNDAPVVTFDDPGAAVGASVNLTASSSADTADVTFRYRPVGTLGAGTAIGSDATAPFGVTWTTAAAAEQQWELIAVATDGGGNVTTSAPRVVLVDRTQPTGSVTAPAVAATVGGPAVALAANGADAGGSGVTLVEWQVKELGAPVFTTVASDATAPYTGSWNSTAAPDGATEIRALITDAAGNVRTTAVVPFLVDSTGPSVTLTDPGAVLSGTATLAATTGGGAVRVEFSVSPADAGTWTQVADDASSPFGTPFDTTALADGLYDLRAIGFDGLGNASAASVREDVRLDNTAPALVSSAPADGSVSTSANQIVLTASEPVTAPGALLDGAAAPAPAASGNQLTFNTGALADGLHVLSGELQDASGTRVPFRVAVTIESTPSADPPPVERSITSSGDWTLSVPGGLVTVRMPAGAWPMPPTPQDYILVLRVDAAPAGGRIASGTQIVDVTARWALAGTYVTDFNAPIEIVFSNPSGRPAIPAHSPDASSWQSIPPLSGSLPASQRDGFTLSGSDVHVWTRHLTYFGLLLDDQAPTAPGGLAGVVAGDGLTLRWIPGADASGQIGNVVLLVNGEPYREFGPTEFEGKLGAFAAGDTRSFTLVQKDAAGNVSPQTAPLRALPLLAGKTLAEATSALGAAGFAVGSVAEITTAAVPPGTVVEPAGLRLALASSAIDLVVARAAAAPQTRLAFSIAGSKRLVLRKSTTMAVRINVSKPAEVTVTLRDSKQRRLGVWKLQVKAGANVVKLRLPQKVRRPGRYSLRWVARSGTETVSRALRVTLVAPTQPTPKAGEIVLAGETPAGEALEPGRNGVPSRITSAVGVDEAFDAIAASKREVGVVVVDADAFGTRFIVDLRAVFPRVGVIAISREPARRVQAIRAGAVLALPRSTTAKRLAKAIALVAGG